MIVRTDHSTETLVSALERQIGPVTAWLHDRINGDGWSVVPYEEYRKVWLAREADATVLFLTL